MNEKLRPPVTKEPFTTPRNATVKRLRNSGRGYSLLFFMLFTDNRFRDRFADTAAILISIVS